MNPRVEKSATVLILNREQEGEELWTAMYDLLFDYRALLLDYNRLERALRGNVSTSVVRRLEEQGVIEP